MGTIRLESSFHRSVFDEPMKAVHRACERLNKLMFSLSLGDSETFQLGLDYDHLRSPDNRAASKEKKREQRRSFETRLRTLLAAQITALEKRLECLDQKIADIDKQLAELSTELEESRKQTAALDEALATLQQTGHLPQDSHRTAWMALHEFLAVTGQAVDLTDPTKLEQALLEAKVHEQHKQEGFTARRYELEVERRHYQLEKDEKSADLDALKRGEPEAVHQAINSQTDGANLFEQLAGQSVSPPRP